MGFPVKAVGDLVPPQSLPCTGIVFHITRMATLMRRSFALVLLFTPISVSLVVRIAMIRMISHKMQLNLPSAAAGAM